MQFTIPSVVKKILKNFEEKNFEIYIVGGAIRDLLTGKIVEDWDFTTNATPDEILQIFPQAYYDNKFGTVGLPSDDKNLKPFEITTFRTESDYSDARRPANVSWGKTLTEDLKRRDFTINSMALSADLSLIDPYEGQKDLKNKIIKTVGDAHERFSEDALRMMRAIRLAVQLDFEIEKKTFQAIHDNVFLINKIAKERIRDEIMKIFASIKAYKGIEFLRKSGLLETILPEAEKMFGVEQKSPKRHHIYDVGTHALMALKFSKSTDPIVRFATFLHDIGKPQTFKRTSEGVITFYNHEVVGTFIVRRITERLRFSKRDKERLITLVRWHQFTVNENQTDSAIRRFIKRVGKENIKDMLDLRTADRLGGGANETSWRLEEFKKRIIKVQQEPFSLQDLKINGKDIMKALNLKPSPKVGEILNQLFKEVVEKKIENEKEALLKRSKQFN